MTLRTLRLGPARRQGLLPALRSVFATNNRWVETVVGPGSPNLELPFAQRSLPTTKSNYAKETVFNTAASGTVEVSHGRTVAFAPHSSGGAWRGRWSTLRFCGFCLQEARSKTLALVRDTLKALPRMNEDYELDMTKATMMRTIRQDIECVAPRNGAALVVGRVLRARAADCLLQLHTGSTIIFISASV